MGYRVEAQKIADFLNEELVGKNIVLTHVKPLNDLADGALSFSKSKTLNVDKNVLILVPMDTKLNNISFSYICVDNPRLNFAKVVNEFFTKISSIGIDKTTIIGNNCTIANNISIGKNCVIGNNVKIGHGTIINNNVLIYDNTVIGANCYIKSGSVIGEDGFGFDFEKDGTPIRIPHIGNVVIGDNVEIGAKNTIARATLEKTVIENNVKTDDQVHIAHNCKIGENTIITACAEISGSVIIGQNCWIGPNSSIIQKVKIGNNVTIGIGSVITEDIQDNKKIMGLESIDLRNLVKLKRRIEYGK
ncbi:UDP-3-O-(3-hydroxymyristoyl)glucosamine N-acyltransferase [Aliarcobacter butzleri]|uniref:UDP-3-O-(3-hydroxymyristoyl)glucosamine N-acyltransferase n=1 Tax=Aliarcobacter butzleri TaxID=28197 RepID=UPI001EDCAC44|nr:UDP-3-O-(3-hydroxymyristoyl)glucosamine N-acyltransferase [Aliarcobacter butzleri]MCG3670031.1 UDP-3-O-(3-hydroxymyristoyl)glucosamine N-acyltransferase [Aliarcobacter butzleri]